MKMGFHPDDGKMVWLQPVTDLIRSMAVLIIDRDLSTLLVGVGAAHQSVPSIRGPGTCDRSDLLFSAWTRTRWQSLLQSRGRSRSGSRFERPLPTNDAACRER